MVYKGKLYYLLFAVVPLLLLAGCGDLEPDMQDTRTVSLNMDFHGKSSSRGSSSVSSTELNQYNTHLILALPSWEYLTSSYKNFYSSFAQELMNAENKKVSMEIPLNTQMKIFAFLFKENYSLSDLFSEVRKVGYYGESQPFSIDAQTNDLRLSISLIQVPGTGTDAGGGIHTTTLAIEEVTAIATTTSDSTPEYTFASTGAGSITYGGSCYSAIIIAHIGNNTITFNALSDGTYSNCTIKIIDSAGNESNTLTIPTFTVDTTVLDTTAPTASVTAATIKNSDNATVRSTETGTAYLVNTAISVSNLASITGSVDNISNSVAISLANTDTKLPATGLVDGTYKVYAVDAAGNLSAASADNVTIVSSGLVDIDGNEYSTVVIGTQHWMAENLKVTKYRNGDNITHITNNSLWSSDTSGAYGDYEENTTYSDTYGRLYNWYAVDNSSGRYICPEGWHVPTKNEYNDLINDLGGFSNAFLKMRETGTEHWTSELAGTSNSSGFTLLGNGFRIYNSGNFMNIKRYSYMWTATHSGSNSAYYLSNASSFSLVSKKYGFGVRCLED
ncbi:MAG: FISUMP domain-containing protein [bacterium]